MTNEELRAARSKIAPTATQADFARILGYEDVNAYRRYENGARPVPTLLGKLITVLLADPKKLRLLK